MVYQSRSGSPSQPWLAPDILDVYDLDTEAQELAHELGIKMVRAATVGMHPQFLRMIRQLIAERVLPNEAKLAAGSFGANHDVWPLDCCPTPQRDGRAVGLVVPSVLQQS